jgi:hypothetical protein
MLICPYHCESSSNRSHAHLRAGSSIFFEASATGAKEADYIVDRDLSPETQSLPSESSHTSNVTQHSGQAEGHDYENHIPSYPVVTEAADGPSSDLLDQSPPAPSTSAWNTTGGLPATKEDP